MPDANSLTFWSEVAARYKDDGRVLFELSGVPEPIAREAMRLAIHKLPMRARFIVREEEV